MAKLFGFVDAVVAMIAAAAVAGSSSLNITTIRCHSYHLVLVLAYSSVMIKVVVLCCCGAGCIVSAWWKCSVRSYHWCSYDGAAFHGSRRKVRLPTFVHWRLACASTIWLAKAIDSNFVGLIRYLHDWQYVTSDGYWTV